jgi:serine/threonine protein kinase
MSYEWQDLVGFAIDGKYPLTELLGEVGDNGVFATEPVGSKAAIVRLAPAASPDSARFLTQWRDAAQLSHPDIAQTFAAGTTDANGLPVVYTVTERPDDSLAEAVRNRALTQDEATALANSMLGALDYLHGRGFAHHAVSPDNIVAMGNRIKLAPWTIGRAEPGIIEEDRIAAGQTIIEVLTQRRPLRGEPVPAGLPADLAFTAAALLRGEAVRHVVAPPAPPKRFHLHTGAVAAASVGVLALVLGVRSWKSGAELAAVPYTPPSPVAAAERTVVRQRTTNASVPSSTHGNWAVVAAIYNEQELAAKRAASMQQRWAEWRPEVTGSGRRFMVILGYAESRKEAEAIRVKARRAGMPSDVYVTRLRR